GSIADNSVSSNQTYTLSLSNPVVKVGDVTYPIADNGFTFSGVEMEKDTSSNSLSCSLNNSTLITTTAQNVTWSTSNSPVFYYSGGSVSYNGPSVSVYTGTVRFTDDTGTRIVSINDSTSGNFDVIGSGSNYSFALTGATLSGATFSSYKSGAESATGTLSGTQVSFNMSSVGIVTRTTAPTDVTWTATINTPTVYYSDGTTTKSGVTASAYSGTITGGTSGKTFSFSNVDSGGGGSISVSVDHDEVYTIAITGCTLSDGATVSGFTNATATAQIPNNGNTLSFTLTPTITETFASSVDVYTSSKITASSTEADDDIKLSKVSIASDTAKKIIKAQTASAFQSKVIAAMKDNKEISVGVVLKDYDSKSDVDESGAASKIEDKAEDSKSSAKIGKYFDISLYLMVGGSVDESDAAKITNSGESIKFSYTVPSKVKSSSSSSTKKRYYRLYRYHDSSAHSVNDWDTSTSISFKTSEFSTYGLAYYDESTGTASSQSSSNKSTSSSGKTPTIANTGDTTSGNKSKSPKTGDNFKPKIWIYLLIVAATISTSAGILLQESREEEDKKDKQAKQ
nr:hypothetical protein [Lachnospiraceae bacterium]